MDPTLGRIVLFTTPRTLQVHPGIVTKVYPDGAVSLVCFRAPPDEADADDPLMRKRIYYGVRRAHPLAAGDPGMPEAAGSWAWPPRIPPSTSG
jgi:hypothetical protein